MKHVLAHRITLGLAILLASLAALFARLANM